MPELDLVHYAETKPHYLKMVIWRFCNAIFFPLLPRCLRTCSLRVFGARIGRDCLIYRTVKVYAPWNLEIGDAVCIGPRVDVFCKGRIRLGNRIVISQDSYLCTGSHDIESSKMTATTEPIDIGNDVWIAARAAILPGVAMGDGVVVGACAVVAKDVSPWSVVVGNPARVVGKREIKG